MAILIAGQADTLFSDPLIEMRDADKGGRRASRVRSAARLAIIVAIIIAGFADDAAASGIRALFR